MINGSRFVVCDVGVALINKLRVFCIHDVTLCDGVLSFSVSMRYENQVKRIIGRREFSLRRQKDVLSALNFFYARSLLVCMLLACGIGYFICGQFAFKTTIVGVSGDEAQFVNNFLASNGFGRITRKSKASDRELLESLVTKFPFVASASMHVKGSKIIISVMSMENYSAEILQLGDIISSVDGVIVDIVLFSGIANVEVGDVVKKGDVLVTGNRPLARIRIFDGNGIVEISGVNRS